MAYKPVEVTYYNGAGSDGVSIYKLVLVWTERVTSEIIIDCVHEAVQEGVRKHLLEDEKFRAKVSDSIEKAASAMPLDVIAEAVRKAILDMRAEGAK